MVSRSQRLCRLCEFPAADGGVHVADVDADKWAEWCRRELGQELHISSDAEQVSVICQFCIWEARLVHESSLDDCCGNNTTDWWTGHDNDHFFQEYFYKRHLIKPSKVVLEKISIDGLGNIADCENQNCPRNTACFKNKIQVCQASPRVKNQSNDLSPKAITKIFQCSLCLKSYQNRKILLSHMRKNHKNAFKCKSYYCTKYFLNEDERQQHEEKFHLNGELSKHVKCQFCGALMRNKDNLHRHIKTQHKDAIKCDHNKTCPNYFHTVVEKNEHIFNKHTKGLQLKITPMKCIYCDKLSQNKHQLVSHVANFHRDVKIKCRVMGCVVYFLSQKENEEHFLQVHQHAESLKKWQCPKCILKCNTKQHLRTHLQIVHFNKANMKSFTCPLCPKSFPAKVNMKDHLNRVHAEQCTCQFCGKAMIKTSMLVHFLNGDCKLDSLPVELN